MDEGYTEEGLDFSGMFDDELLEIVNSSSGRYRQEVVDGAKNELEKRGPPVSPASPASPETVPGSKLFSAGQVALATFLGAPIAGSLLLAQNYHALGKAGSARRPLLVGGVSTTLLFILAFFLPEKSPSLALPACIGMYIYARQEQGAAIDDYLKAGGRKGSWKVAIIVALGCAAILLVLSIAVVIAFDIGLPEDETGGPLAKVKVSKETGAWVAPVTYCRHG
jgi:hypothetical protein